MWDTQSIAKFERNGFFMNVKSRKYDTHIFFCNRHSLITDIDYNIFPVYDPDEINKKNLYFGPNKKVKINDILIWRPGITDRRDTRFIDLVGFSVSPEGLENLQKVEIRNVDDSNSKSVVIKGVKTNGQKHEFVASRVTESVRKEGSKRQAIPTYDDVITEQILPGVSGSLVGLYDDNTDNYQPWAVHEAGFGNYGYGVSLYDFLENAEVVAKIPQKSRKRKRSFIGIDQDDGSIYLGQRKREKLSNIKKRKRKSKRRKISTKKRKIKSKTKKRTNMK